MDYSMFMNLYPMFRLDHYRLVKPFNVLEEVDIEVYRLQRVMHSSAIERLPLFMTESLKQRSFL